MLFFTEFFDQKEFKRNVKERNWLDQYFCFILFDFVFTPTEEPFKRPRNFSFYTFREISKEIQIWPAQPLSLFWKKTITFYKIHDVREVTKCDHIYTFFLSHF